MLDSIQFVHFDDYNNLSVADYKTIGFTQLPTDVAFVGITFIKWRSANDQRNISAFGLYYR